MMLFNLISITALLALPSVVYAYIDKKRSNTMINSQRMSNSARNNLKRREVFKSTVYNDQAGNLTIGYGHLLTNGETYPPISEATALELFDLDLMWAENCVKNNVDVILNKNQFDSLVSFVFNVGCSAFTNSTLLKKLNAGAYSAIPTQLKRWKYVTVNDVKKISNGLIDRRDYESNLFVA